MRAKLKVGDKAAYDCNGVDIEVGRVIGFEDDFEGESMVVLSTGEGKTTKFYDDMLLSEETVAKKYELFRKMKEEMEKLNENHPV